MRVVIDLEPQIFGKHKKYFWFIECDGANYGHGYAESVEKASKDAEKYYKENVKGKM